MNNKFFDGDIVKLVNYTNRYIPIMSKKFEPWTLEINDPDQEYIIASSRVMPIQNWGSKIIYPIVPKSDRHAKKFYVCEENLEKIGIEKSKFEINQELFQIQNSINIILQQLQNITNAVDNLI